MFCELYFIKFAYSLITFVGNEPEIESTVKSLSTCLNLLLPTLEDFFIIETNAETECNHKSQGIVGNEDVSQNDLRSFGININYNLSLQINPNEKINITQTEENSSIIDNANDCVRLINNRFMPMVKNWLKVCCKYSDGYL